MDTGGNTALDPSRPSYQLQREGSLAYKEPNILTTSAHPLPHDRRAKTVAETSPQPISQSCR
jgi:hypothetical protein